MGIENGFPLVNCRTGETRKTENEPRVGDVRDEISNLTGDGKRDGRQSVREKITYLQIKKLTLLESKPSFMVRIPRPKGKPGVAGAWMMGTTLSRCGRESL